jgi:integrase
MKKPDPIIFDDFRSYVKRGPKAGTADLWYWQAFLGVARKTRTAVPAASGWRTRADQSALMKRLLRDGKVGARPASQGAVLVTCDDMMKAYVQWQKGRRDRGALSPSSYSGYYYTRRQLKPHVGELLIKSLGDQATMEQLRQDWLAAVPGSAHQMMKILRQAFKWAKKHGYINTGLTMVDVKVPKPEAAIYNQHCPEVSDVLKVSKALESKWSPWRPVAYELMAYTGARVHEVVGIETANVDLHNSQLTLVRKGSGRGSSVGRKRRVTLPLHADAVEIIQAWLKKRDHWVANRPYHITNGDRCKHLLFGLPVVSAARSLRDAIRMGCKKAGLETRHTPHGLRRLAATRLIEAGVDKKTYEEVMGHSFAMGLKVYAKSRDSTKREAIAVLALPREEDETVVQGPWQPKEEGRSQ